MSHFAVMVIGENPEDQLQPYHEYECTGIEDEYVVFVEAEEDVPAEYEKNKDEYDTIEDFADDTYGYFQKDGKWGRLTNPNSKWDWYQLGGRWTGFLKLKPDTTGNMGQPGLLTNPAKAGYADQALKKDIDFEAMRTDAAEKASKEWDLVNEVIKDLPIALSWTHVRTELHKDNIDAAREFYGNQPRVKAYRVLEKSPFSDLEPFQEPKEVYVNNARNSAVSTFAILKEKQWVEKGNMGWWGMVSNETDKTLLDESFNKMLNELPEDTLISIYDCHI